MKESKFEIINLNCSGCVNTIVAKLTPISRVAEVKVNLEKAIVSVFFEGSLEREVIKKQLTKLGYPEKGDAHNAIDKAKSLYSCVTGKINSIK